MEKRVWIFLGGATEQMHEESHFGVQEEEHNEDTKKS